jgi:hypothetical protein
MRQYYQADEARLLFSKDEEQIVKALCGLRFEE